MISTIEYLVVYWSMFDLQDRESDDDHEVLDTQGGAGQMNSNGQVSTQTMGKDLRGWNKGKCYRHQESKVQRWRQARRAWHYGGV